MSLIVSKTNDRSIALRRNTLLIGHAGAGKTKQCANMQSYYGKGLILSGEAGLLSLGDVEIDYIAFTSFNGKHDPANGVFSFTGLCREIAKPEFASSGYNWLAVDSLTELADMAYIEAEANAPTGKSGQRDGFAVWGEYGRLMVGAIKFVRDLKINVLVTALVKEDTDPDGRTIYLPLVKGNALQRQIPGIFDNVFALVKKERKTPTGSEVQRLIVTDEVGGYPGKYRCPYQTLQPIEQTGDITDLFRKLDAPIKSTTKEIS